MKVWEKRTDESAKAYAAFCVYRDLEPQRRSIDKAYDLFSKQNGGKKKYKRAPHWWFTWSTDYEWVDRVTAFDADQQRKALIAIANKRQKDIERTLCSNGTENRFKNLVVVFCTIGLRI